MGKPKLTVLHPEENTEPDIDGLLKMLGEQIRDNNIYRLLFIGEDKEGNISMLFNGCAWTDTQLHGTLYKVNREIENLYNGEE